MKSKKWIIFTEFGINAIPYILDSSNLDVSTEELSECIYNQYFNKFLDVEEK